jgi:hypothetical protein
MNRIELNIYIQSSQLLKGGKRTLYHTTIYSMLVERHGPGEGGIFFFRHQLEENELTSTVFKQMNITIIISKSGYCQFVYYRNSAS